MNRIILSIKKTIIKFFILNNIKIAPPLIYGVSSKL